MRRCHMFISSTSNKLYKKGDNFLYEYRIDETSIQPESLCSALIHFMDPQNCQNQA